MTTMTIHPLAHRHHHHGWWWKTLLAGLALWVVTTIVTAVTANTNLVPTLILLGSFLVPFCVVLFVIERVQGNVTTLQLILAFFVGGIFGDLGASLLEANLQQNLAVYLLVGLIEEFVKAVILVIIAWRVTPKTAAQGALLGATVGAGFAAFESAGYAFNAAITSQGIDLVSLLQTEVVRAILAPVGHVLWTALLGAVIFGATSLGKHHRWSWWIPVALVGAAVLHGLWDSMSTIASMVALLFTGQAMQDIRNGFLPASTADAVENLSTVLYIVGLSITAAIGVIALWRVLRHYLRKQRLRAAQSLSLSESHPKLLEKGNTMEITPTSVVPSEFHASGTAPRARSQLLSNIGGLQTYAIALQRDDEVATTLLDFARSHHVTSGHFTAVGALREVRIAWYDLLNKEYTIVEVLGQVEALSLVGDVGIANGLPVVQAHVVVGLQDGTTRGGHLVHALASPTLEVTFSVEPTVLRRSLDEYSGLILMDLPGTKITPPPSPQTLAIA
jgi:RsiW-degrading membrane proteinase PrsW (M82 family)/predicted DNA-binding protein with PD1-like motif